MLDVMCMHSFTGWHALAPKSHTDGGSGVMSEGLVTVLSHRQFYKHVLAV